MIVAHNSRASADKAILITLLALGAGACGPAIDHTATWTRLRAAITAPIDSPAQMDEHNQLVRDVVDSNALDGLRMFEVQERIGRGDQCGSRALCHERGFRPTDWVYDVGRQASDPELPAGPTLIVGFDTAGFVVRTHYVTRSRSR